MKLLSMLIAVFFICSNSLYAAEPDEAPSHSVPDNRTLNHTVFFNDLPKSEYFAHVSTQYIAKILDKQGQAYYLRDSSLLNQGYASKDFDIAKDKKDTTYRVYSEFFEPTVGGCHSKNYKNDNLNKDAVQEMINAKYHYENYMLKKGEFYPDKERNENLLLVIEETDCSTNLPRFVSYIISPDDNRIRITPIERK